MIILWVALGITVTFMIIMVVAAVRAVMSVCPHGNTPAGCEACYDDYLTWGHQP